MLNQSLQPGEVNTKRSWLTKIRNQPFRYLVILLFLINITLFASNIGLWISAASQNLFITADFTNSYTAFMMVRRGDGVNLYDLDLQAKYQQVIMGDKVFEGGLLPYLNPPFIALFFSFLSLVPINTAFYLWTLIQCCLLIWLLFSLNRLFSHWSKLERILMVSTILAFWPLANTFLLGQFSLFLLVGLLQVYISMKNSRLVPAGLWLVVSTIKPHSLLVTGMLTLNKRYWRVAVTSAISCVVIFILTWLILGLRPWIQYISSLFNQLGSFTGRYGAHPDLEFTIRGLLTNILGDSHGQLVNTVSLVFLTAGMVFIWLIWRRANPQAGSRFALFFALTILLSVVLSLHLNAYDALVLVLPAVLFYDYLRQEAYPRKAYSIFILFIPLIFFIFTFNRFNILGVLRPPLAMMLILLGWVIKYLVQDIRKGLLNTPATTDTYSSK